MERKEKRAEKVRSKPAMAAAQAQFPTLLETLAAPWYAGEIRKANRERSGLSDVDLDNRLAAAETGAALARMWRVILREASFAMLDGLAARAQKETSAAKLLADLCEMSATKGDPPPADAEADFSEFERAILDNLRAAVTAKARVGSGDED